MASVVEQNQDEDEVETEFDELSRKYNSPHFAEVDRLYLQGSLEESKQKSSKILVAEYDQSLKENTTYKSVSNLDLAKYGVSVYLFFDFLKFMIWFFIALSLLGLVAAYLNIKGTHNSQ